MCYWGKFDRISSGYIDSAVDAGFTFWILFPFISYDTSSGILSKTKEKEFDNAKYGFLISLQ